MASVRGALVHDFVSQQTDAHRVIVRAIVFEDHPVIAGEQPSRFARAIRLEQRDQRIVRERLARGHAQGAPFANRFPLAVTLVHAGAYFGDALENTFLAFMIFGGIYLMLSLTASILREQVSG